MHRPQKGRDTPLITGSLFFPTTTLRSGPGNETDAETMIVAREHDFFQHARNLFGRINKILLF